MIRKVHTVSYDLSSRSTVKYGKKSVPCLRFTGLWLTRIVGLHIGDKVQVLADTGKIAILKIEKGAHGNNG